LEKPVVEGTAAVRIRGQQRGCPDSRRGRDADRRNSGTTLTAPTAAEAETPTDETPEQL